MATVEIQWASEAAQVAWARRMECDRRDRLAAKRASLLPPLPTTPRTRAATKEHKRRASQQQAQADRFDTMVAPHALMLEHAKRYARHLTREEVLLTSQTTRPCLCTSCTLQWWEEMGDSDDEEFTVPRCVIPPRKARKSSQESTDTL